MFAHLIGHRSPNVTNWVERGAVRRFALAISDPHPLYIDDEAAKKGPYSRLLAPPTFPITLNYGEIEGLTLPTAGLIHGGQSFNYIRPLFVDDKVHCHTVLENAYEKQGANGLLSFLVLVRVVAEPPGALICTLRSTLIITEAVRGSTQS